MLVNGRCSVAANANEIMSLEKDLEVNGLLSSLSSLFTTETSYVSNIQKAMNVNKIELLKMITNNEVTEENANGNFILKEEFGPFIGIGNYPMIEEYFSSKVETILSSKLREELSLLEIILKNENNKSAIFLNNNELKDEQRYTIEYGMRYDVSNLRRCSTFYLAVETNLNVKYKDEIKKYPFVRCEYIFDVTNDHDVNSSEQ